MNADRNSKTRRRVLWLLRGTAVYMVAEGVASVGAGIAARSVALVAFGLDSGIELAAAIIVLRRFRRGQDEETDAERRAERLVGVTLLLLAAYTVAQAVWSLVARREAAETRVGIAVAALAVVVMPALAVAKMRAAKTLGSRALAVEAKESLACALMSLLVLVGLAAEALFRWWWADPVAALLIVPWLVREGIESAFGSEGNEEGDDDES